MLKIKIIRLRELNSIDRGKCIIYAEVEFRTPDTPLLYIKNAWAPATRLLDQKKKSYPKQSKLPSKFLWHANFKLYFEWVNYISSKNVTYHLNQMEAFRDKDISKKTEVTVRVIQRKVKSTTYKNCHTKGV